MVVSWDCFDVYSPFVSSFYEWQFWQLNFFYNILDIAFDNIRIVDQFARFASVESLFNPRSRGMVIEAHPDDLAIHAGGIAEKLFSNTNGVGEIVQSWVEPEHELDSGIRLQCDHRQIHAPRSPATCH